jgi:anti-anti-sigma factor
VHDDALVAEPREASVAGELSDPSRIAAPHGSVAVEAGGPTTVVVLRGEVDSDLSADLLDVVDEVIDVGAPVVLDAAEVTFMDSAGVGFISRICARSPHRVRLRAASESVEFLLGLTGLLEVVDWDGDGRVST